MFGIRKFVGYTGAAAGIGAAIALALSSQTGMAAAPTNRVDEHGPTQFTPSAACKAAIDAIKTAFKADTAEDNSERQARANPEAAETPGEDATERANLLPLFSNARTACAPAATSVSSQPKFTPSAACTAAIQALKAAWAQGKPTAQAQWQNLNSLGLAVRSACGWNWSSAGRPPTR